ncbi:MAG: hypothetical protein JSU58_03490 [Dehalococcoidales bacterium]|nr:MAG: hypothetical protein JSU58_03490 [Dehalococcoidales bacterium]
MTDELGKVEKPEAKQYEGKRKLYLVPLVYTYEGAPADYTEKYELYWKQAQEHIRNLETKMGTVDLVYHESVTITGDKGLEIMEKLSPLSCQITKDRCQSGAKLEVIEDAELTEETMDWERHFMMGFISNKGARMVSDLYAEASKKRYEHISNRINETLGEDDAAILFIRENHRIQFPSDIEVFSIAPPALDEIHRWLRERPQQAEEEDIGESSGGESYQEVESENTESSQETETE